MAFQWRSRRSFLWILRRRGTKTHFAGVGRFALDRITRCELSVNAIAQILDRLGRIRIRSSLNDTSKIRAIDPVMDGEIASNLPKVPTFFSV
jgi:hypothetical protein